MQEVCLLIRSQDVAQWEVLQVGRGGRRALSVVLICRSNLPGVLQREVCDAGSLGELRAAVSGPAWPSSEKALH